MPSLASFGHRPTPQARLLGVLTLPFGFLAWCLGGYFRRSPNVGFVPLCVGVLLLAGAPERNHGHHPMLHGDARIAGSVVGAAILLGMFAYWLAYERPGPRS